MAIRVGTEIEGVPAALVPGAKVVGRAGRGRANAGQGNNSTTPPSSAYPRGCIVLTAQMPVGVITNRSGTSTTNTALTTINPAFAPTAPSFPGAASDDNDIQWVLAVPTDMANTPNPVIRLHIIAQ